MKSVGLIINDNALCFIRNQRRCYDYIKLCCEFFEMEHTNLEQTELGSFLISSEILRVIKDNSPEVEKSLRYPEKIESQKCFVSCSVEEQQLLEDLSYQIEKIAIDTDQYISYRPDSSEYCQYINWLAEALSTLQGCGNLPAMNFNDEKYIMLQPFEEEVMQADNYYVDCLQQINLNNNFMQDENELSHLQWVVYLIMCIGSAGNEIIHINLQEYAIFLGSTNSENTLLATAFHLSQLIFCTLWLYVSDEYGRKVFLNLSFIIYAVSTSLIIVVGCYVEQSTILWLILIRAVQGAAGTIAPFVFLILSDIIPPKERSYSFILANCFSIFGGAISSALTLIFLYGGYSAGEYDVGSLEYNNANRVEFVATHCVALILFFISLIFGVFFLRETSPKKLFMRDIAKLQKHHNILIKNNSLRDICRNMYEVKNFRVEYFAYILSLISANNFKNGGETLFSKAYGFTDTTIAKKTINTFESISTACTVILIGLLSQKFISKYGEMKIIITTEFITFALSIFETAFNLPFPLWEMCIIMIMVTIQTVYCDVIFIYFISMSFNPNDSGKIMAMFQTGNSIGRLISSYYVGVVFDFNIRDAQMFHSLFASACLFLLYFVVAPVESTDIKNEREQMIKQKYRIAMI